MNLLELVSKFWILPRHIFISRKFYKGIKKVLQAPFVFNSPQKIQFATKSARALYLCVSAPFIQFL